MKLNISNFAIIYALTFAQATFKLDSSWFIRQQRHTTTMADDVDMASGAPNTDLDSNPKQAAIVLYSHYPWLCLISCGSGSGPRYGVITVPRSRYFLAIAQIFPHPRYRNSVGALVMSQGDNVYRTVSEDARRSIGSAALASCAS